jgi:hypothetical protein
MFRPAARSFMAGTGAPLAAERALLSAPTVASGATVTLPLKAPTMLSVHMVQPGEGTDDVHAQNGRVERQRNVPWRLLWA